jgi:4-aminobutyrate aminotransferase-like enzyme
MMARGVLVGIGGQRRSVVRLTPPLTITAEERKLLEATVLDVFDEVVSR